MNEKDILMAKNMHGIDMILIILANLDVELVKANLLKEIDVIKKGMGPKELNLVGDFLDAVSEAKHRAKLLNIAGDNVLSKVNTAKMN